MSDYSPGPWRTSGPSTRSRAGSEIWDIQNFRVATVESSDANARLIAAAPEMFHLLQNALAACYGGGECGMSFAWMEDVRILMNKIEGKLKGK